MSQILFFWLQKCTLQCTFYNVLFTIYFFFSMYFLQFTFSFQCTFCNLLFLFNVLFTMYFLQCTFYNVLFAMYYMYFLQCTFYNVLFTMYFLQFAMYFSEIYVLAYSVIFNKIVIQIFWKRDDSCHSYCSEKCHVVRYFSRNIIGLRVFKEFNQSWNSNILKLHWSISQLLFVFMVPEMYVASCFS